MEWNPWSHGPGSIGLVPTATICRFVRTGILHRVSLPCIPANVVRRKSEHFRAQYGAWTMSKGLQLGD